MTVLIMEGPFPVTAYKFTYTISNLEFYIFHDGFST